MLRIIPLGGLGEVGKNMTVFELDGEIVIVDAGLAFPRDEHLGVDLILPDFGYLLDKEVRAVLLTHAHEDHVGALPYFMREVRVKEILATKLTLGLVQSKLDAGEEDLGIYKARAEIEEGAGTLPRDRPGEWKTAGPALESLAGEQPVPDAQQTIRKCQDRTGRGHRRRKAGVAATLCVHQAARRASSLGNRR